MYVLRVPAFMRIILRGMTGLNRRLSGNECRVRRMRHRERQDSTACYETTA